MKLPCHFKAKSYCQLQQLSSFQHNNDVGQKAPIYIYIYKHITIYTHTIRLYECKTKALNYL